jgi:hypothetical protein
MKHLKIIGLTAVAAALLAFATSSASADVLCTTSTEPCDASKRITTIEMSIEGSLAMNELMTCTTGSLHTDIETQDEGVNPSGPITSLTWGPKGAGCTTTLDTVKTGKLELRTEGGVPEVWASESEFTRINMGVSCTYGFGTGTTLGRLTIGTPGTLDIDAAVKLVAGGFACPQTHWTGSYKLTNHESVFVKNV